MDYASFITILTESDSGEMEESPLQTVNINVENVK
jgi:hypothetical protein